jgi:hypothetical protein
MDLVSLHHDTKGSRVPFHSRSFQTGIDSTMKGAGRRVDSAPCISEDLKTDFLCSGSKRYFLIILRTSGSSLNLSATRIILDHKGQFTFRYTKNPSCRPLENWCPYWVDFLYRVIKILAMLL